MNLSSVMTETRLVYFGTGAFAQRHLSELAKWPNVSVAYAVSYPGLDRATFAEIHQNTKGSTPQMFDSLEAFLSSDPSFDGAVIATPVDSHFNLASTLLRSRKPLYIEKPFMSTFAEAAEIADRADRFHVPVVIGANRCIFPAYRAAADALQGEIIGSLESLSLYYNHSWDELTKDSAWRQDPSHPGSGLVMDHFAHYGHYLVNLGFYPRRVEHLRSRYNERGVDVEASFGLYNQKGKCALVIMIGSERNKPRTEEIIIYGELGKINIKFEGQTSNAYLQIHGKSVRRLDTAAAIRKIYDLGISDHRSHPGLIHNFLHIVQGELVENASPARDGVFVASMTEAMLKARKEQRIVSFDV